MADEENKIDIALNETPEEDDVVQFEYNADGEEDLKATLKKLRKDLKEEKVKAQEYLTLLQRERADFLNFKKDVDVRLSRRADIAREQFIEELLPVLDAYDMAFSNKEAWEKVDENWRRGVEYIHSQLLKVLADYGVSEIAPKEGEMLDALAHEGMESVDTDNTSKDHTIAKVIQKGYKMADRVLRPARVKVYKANS